MVWPDLWVIIIPCSINHMIVPPPAHRAILRRTRQEELQQLQNVPVIPTRLRRGAIWGRTGPPDAVLIRRLCRPVAPIQSQHQLRGLLLHNTEAFKQGQQVHRLPRLLGVETKRTPCTLSFTVLAVCLSGCLCAHGWVRCVKGWRMHVNVCASVLKLCWMTRAWFGTRSFWLIQTMCTIMLININHSFISYLPSTLKTLSDSECVEWSVLKSGLSFWSLKLKRLVSELIDRNNKQQLH